MFDELTEDDLVEILKNPNNPIIVSKRQDFKAYGIDIKFEETALRKIAEVAAEEKTGARSLVSAVEKVLIPFEKDLPSTDIKRLVVTPEVVDNPEVELKSLKESPDSPERFERFENAAKEELDNIVDFITSRLKDFREISELDIYRERCEIIAEIYLKTTSDINTSFEEFVRIYKEIKKEERTLSEKLELDISFDEGAIDELIRESISSGQEPSALAFYMAKKLEYGLKLIKGRSGIEEFVINSEAVTNMDSYINKLVKDLYKANYDEKSLEDKHNPEALVE